MEAPVNATRFPRFGTELERPFEVAEGCYDCAEFFDGCNGWPAGRELYCADRNRLPDVQPGRCGQVFPASGTGRQMKPRGIGNERPAEPGPTPKTPARAGTRTRRPSPAAIPGPDGERLCGCGTPLPKRRRCCNACRRQRRVKTLSNRRSSKKAATTVDAASDRPFPASGGRLSRRSSMTAL